MRDRRQLRVLTFYAFILAACGSPAPRCGDSRVDPGEQCDRGILNSDTGECTTMCAAPICGDGFIGPGESCEDSNDDPLDGCAECVGTGRVLARTPLAVERCDHAGWLVVARDGEIMSGCQTSVVATSEAGGASRTIVASADFGFQFRFQTGIPLSDDTLLVTMTEGISDRQTKVHLAKLDYDGTVQWLVELPTDEYTMLASAGTAIELGDGTAVVGGFAVPITGGGVSAGLWARIDLTDGSILARRYELSIERPYDLALLGSRLIATGHVLHVDEDQAILEVDPATLAVSSLYTFGPVDTWQFPILVGVDPDVRVAQTVWSDDSASVITARVTETGLAEETTLPGYRMLVPAGTEWVAAGGRQDSRVALLGSDLSRIWQGEFVDANFAPVGATFGANGMLYVISSGDPAALYTIVP